MYEIFLILILLTMGLLSHLVHKHRLLEWSLRFIILSTAIIEVIICFAAFTLHGSEYVYIAVVYAVAAIMTILLLFLQFRQFISWLITGVQLIITAQVFVPFIKRDITTMSYFRQKRIFIPGSFPHLIALYIYVTTATYVLTSHKLKVFGLLTMYCPDPVKFQQILSEGGMIFILLSFCGIGIYVTRTYKEALRRLYLEQPNKVQIVIGLALVFLSFAYDAFWLMNTHSMSHQTNLASRLSYYKADTFAMAGGFIPSVVLALVAACFAAIGEEALIKGALQPVFGILPSAWLHSLIHSQMNHEPLFVLQVFIWSAFMGLIKRYTNTTTVIIGHAFFNLVTILLYVVNP